MIDKIDMATIEGTFGDCPICGASRIAEDLQPVSGTHAFTIVYECGTEIDYPIGQIGASFGATCDGKIKKLDFDDILDKFGHIGEGFRRLK